MRRLIRFLFTKLINASDIRRVIREEIDTALIQQLRNIDYGLHFKAIIDSANFVHEHIPLHKRFTNKELRSVAVKMAPSDGLVLEFGVYKGGSIRQFAQLTSRMIYGFDSFEGIPEPWTLRKKGDFSVNALPDVPSNVVLIKGWFNDTLPVFLDEHENSVAFVHLDCDLYSSSKMVLEMLADRMRPGTIIILDDFLEEPGWQHEQNKAFFEFVEAHAVKYEYIGYTVSTPSSAVSVVLTAIDNKTSADGNRHQPLWRR